MKFVVQLVRCNGQKIDHFKYCSDTILGTTPFMDCDGQEAAHHLPYTLLHPILIPDSIGFVVLLHSPQFL